MILSKVSSEKKTLCAISEKLFLLILKEMVLKLITMRSFPEMSLFRKQDLVSVR